MQTLDRIRNLAQLLNLKKTAGESFVLMLGAGASLSSGVKPTATIMEELVSTYATQTASADTIEDRFDELWRTGSEANRGLWLKPYLNRPPSSGYHRLAELIQRGFFDVVITFNFDRLLERALDDAGFTDYKTIIRGETDVQSIAKLVQSREPRVKILKMHGSLQSSDYFLFSKEEMLNYPPDLEKVISDLTSRDIVICGYAFNDECLRRAFDPSKGGGDIYYVNPSGAVENVKGLLSRRRSLERVIGGDLGKFDDFVETLHRQLTTPVEASTARTRQNSFKFLDHYQEDQQLWFLGRRKLTRKVLKLFEGVPPPALFLSGKPKVGKTSFIRAGLTPYLLKPLKPRRGKDANKYEYECVYVRCKQDVEPQLRAALKARFSVDDEAWETLLPRLKTLTSKCIVIFLDQFERAARAAQESPDKKKSILDLAGRLLKHADERLVFVFIAVDENAFSKLFISLKRPEDPADIPPLPPERVASIIRYAARKGDVALDPDLITTLSNEYREGLKRGDQSFTLAHVQTICYYLARGFLPKWEGYDQLPAPGLRAALDSIKDNSSLMDLLDDLSTEERRLIRSFLKMICDPGRNTRQIVEFIRNHFPDIREDRFPEPIA